MLHTITEIDRFRIAEMKKDGVKNSEIAKRIGCCERTIYYELKRGRVNLNLPICSQGNEIK